MLFFRKNTNQQLVEHLVKYGCLENSDLSRLESVTTKESSFEALASLLGQIYHEKFHSVGYQTQGGMGAIFQTKHMASGKTYVQKTLLKEVDECAERKKEAEERFKREILLMTKVAKHSRIPSLQFFGITKKQEKNRLGISQVFYEHFYVMDLISGNNFFNIISDPTIDSDNYDYHMKAYLHGLLEALDALDFLHKNDILHRDFTPQNIILEEGSYHGYLIDLGFSKHRNDDPLTSTGEIVGAIGYKAPEILMGKKENSRSEVYAAGVVLYSLLSREIALNNDPKKAGQIIQDRQTNFSIVGSKYANAFQDVISKATHFEPKKRYSSIKKFRKDCVKSYNQIT